MLPKCWPYIEKTNFHENLHRRSCWTFLHMSDSLAWIWAWKYFPYFLSKIMDVFQLISSRFDNNFSWFFEKMFSISNSSQRIIHMQKSSARFFVQIFMKNLFFNIWSTFRQHVLTKCYLIMHHQRLKTFMNVKVI